MNEKIQITLPIPVSINHAYKNAGDRRVKTTQTHVWQNAAKAKVYDQKYYEIYREAINKNKLIRDSCLVFIGKKLKISIYELRKKFNKEYELSYKFYFGNDILRDAPNFEKLLTDFLCEHNLIVDDQFIKKLTIERMDNDIENPRVEIEIISLDSNKILS
jgi:Holliday junction resolvase RusA-like endonuclease